MMAENASAATPSGDQPNRIRPDVAGSPAGGAAADAGDLDDIDRHIVRELARDARTANNALAERVGIAPSTCLGRVRSLRERGVIRGYHADV
ncbi:MAG: Lrp/AsnC family transcriptional regulator, partial [Trebonia sp.]